MLPAPDYFPDLKKCFFYVASDGLPWNKASRHMITYVSRSYEDLNYMYI